AAKWLPQDIADAAAWHGRIYYMIFLAAMIWALARGAARGGVELLWVAAAATALIPLASLPAPAGLGWSHGGADMLVDGVALAGVLSLAAMARAAGRRAADGPRDSVWSHGRRRSQDRGTSRADPKTA